MKEIVELVAKHQFLLVQLQHSLYQLTFHNEIKLTSTYRSFKYSKYVKVFCFAVELNFGHWKQAVNSYRPFHSMPFPAVELYPVPTVEFFHSRYLLLWPTVQAFPFWEENSDCSAIPERRKITTPHFCEKNWILNGFQWPSIILATSSSWNMI